MLSISSRNTVPPSACSNLPMRFFTAPVKAPSSWPNSSLSMMLSGRAPQFTATKGAGAACAVLVQRSGPPVPCRCRSRPSSSTSTSVPATASILWRRCTMHGARPTIAASSPSTPGDASRAIAVLEHQRALLHGPRTTSDQRCDGAGLLDEVVGAVAHGLHGHGDVAVPGDQNHGNVRVHLCHLAQQRHAVCARHAYVGDQHPGPVGGNQVRHAARAAPAGDLEALQLQGLARGHADVLFVVDEDDGPRFAHATFSVTLPARGSVTRNSAPPPARLAAATEPP